VAQLTALNQSFVRVLVRQQLQARGGDEVHICEEIELGVWSIFAANTGGSEVAKGIDRV
jgi:hypothetical protein